LSAHVRISVRGSHKARSLSQFLTIVDCHPSAAHQYVTKAAGTSDFEKVAAILGASNLYSIRDVAGLCCLTHQALRLAANAVAFGGGVGLKPSICLKLLSGRLTRLATFILLSSDGAFICELREAGLG